MPVTMPVIIQNVQMFPEFQRTQNSIGWMKIAENALVA